MRRFVLLAAVVAALGLSSTTQPLRAQNIADQWRITPAAGLGQGFETALKAHLDWRSEAGDPWTWTVYTVETGEDVGDYVLRSSGHTWADFDAYEAGFGPEAGLRVAATFGDMLESVTHTIDATDTTRTHYPADMSEMNLFQVVTWYARPGMMPQLQEAMGKFTDAIVENDYPLYYVYTSTASGGGRSQAYMRGVFFYRNWAEFEGPDMTVEELMMDAYGEDDFQEIGRAFGEAVQSTDEYVLRVRRDLSMGN